MWACFPLFHPNILRRKKAGENGELGTPLVEQRPGCWSSVVVALEQPLHAPGQAAQPEKKGTHLGHARLPGNHSKDSVTWLADIRVPACPRNHVPNPGVHLPSPHSCAGRHEVPTWDNHLDLKKNKRTKPAKNSGAQSYCLSSSCISFEANNSYFSP